MRFALVAGELSGDILGAAIIHALRARFAQATFYGVAGPRMVEAGCEAIESIEALSLMGLAEVVRELPRLFALRSRLVERFAADRPDCLIGIDAPDFNLGLERRLKARGLTTVHVVSPTVWAWRAGRARTMARSVDLMLCLYPFEPKFYAGHGLRAEYIGHPLADELDDATTAAQARQALGLPVEGPVLAVLPGSRGGELKYLAQPFAQCAAWLATRMPGLRFVTPMAKPSLRPMLEQAIAQQAPPLDWTLIDGRSREVMQAADVVLLASGTATLECLLLGRPMVVGYHTAPLTAWLMLSVGLLKTKWVSLPNILTSDDTVPELLQRDCTPELLGREVRVLLRNAYLRARQLERFDAVRSELKRDSADLAAAAIGRLIAERGPVSPT